MDDLLVLYLTVTVQYCCKERQHHTGCHDSPILVHYTLYGYNNIRSQTSWSCPAGCSVRHRVWVNTGSCLSVCFNRAWSFICRFVTHPATLCCSKEKKNITFKNYFLFMYQIMYSVCIPNELSLKRWSPTCIINFNPLRVSFIIYTVLLDGTQFILK